MYETEANQNPLRQGLFLLEFEIGFYRLISKKKRNMIINKYYLEQIVLLLNEIS
jgi:hypothetical protein